MTISEALKAYKDIEADLLLGFVLKQPKEFLYLNPNKPLTKAQAESYRNMAKKRRQGIPAAYLLGYKDFYGLKFKVNRHVLIPRPETEWLVENALRIIKAKQSKSKTGPLKVLDVGSGSGCIGISIRKNTPSQQVKFVASDVSAEALKVARSNAKTHNAKIQFIKSDLFTNLTGKFDLIVANLPYVPITDYKKLYPNLKYEPKLALTDGKDDFPLLRRFLAEVSKHLKERAVLLLEVDPKFIKTLKDNQWRIVKDIRGLNRFDLMVNYKK